MMQDVDYWNAEFECMPRSQLERYQLDRVREQLAFVYERSPFYRCKFDDAGLRPDDIRTVDDVRRIPFTEKEELRRSQSDHPPWGDFACIGPEEAIRVFQTSGTTGKPVRILLNNKDWFENYYDQFMHFRCGYGLTKSDVLFVPFNYGLFAAWWGFQAAMEKAGLMIIPGGGQSSEHRLRALVDWGASVVCGTPTYLLYLAETASKLGLDLAGSPIRKVVAAGEPGAAVLTTKKAMEEQWGAECFDDIGSTEIGNFGYECAEHQGTHMIEGAYLAEVLDPETLEPLPDGTTGELVLTNLTCESVPLIRYRMKDLVRFNRDRCGCGRTYLRLDGGVLGRVDDMFHYAGVNIYPGQIQDLLHGVGDLSLEYQIMVPKMGCGKHLTIRVEPAHAYVAGSQLEQARDSFIDSVKFRVGVTPEVEIVEVGDLPRVEGKAKRVIRET
ncbi:MAG: phenylacetate--CoA ligase [Alphaproteobacteria bacterium]|nr:phenylacetate--CoA ligase [Alphaproteobacteria bacterium]